MPGRRLLSGSWCKTDISVRICMKVSTDFVKPGNPAVILIIQSYCQENCI
jgi:hypothetical protein